MKYEIKPSNQFRKDVKTAQKRGYDIDLLTAVIKKLANGEKLEARHNVRLINQL